MSYSVESVVSWYMIIQRMALVLFQCMYVENIILEAQSSFDLLYSTRTYSYNLLFGSNQFSIPTFYRPSNMTQMNHSVPQFAPGTH